MNKFTNIVPYLFLAIVITIITAIFLVEPVNKVINTRTKIATVTEKGIKNQGKKGKYLIFTEQDGKTSVYEVSDSLFKNRWDSSDVYAGIKVGQTYEFTVSGNRVEFLSLYPNIYEYRPVESGETTDE